MRKILSLFAAVLFAGSMMAATTMTCAEARDAALSVSANNELYNDGEEIEATGYVTSIQTAYNSQYNNVSFWIADAADGGNVVEAYRAACASEADAPKVGDKVTVTGQLTKYNTTPEFAAGCTYVIVEAAAPAQNLGEKTIAEFLELKNVKDTCVITGVVANIKKNDDGSYNKYGNFDLVDGEASVYVYGLLTADGQAQKFQEMGVDEGDSLTVKAVYSEYNNKVQAKNAVFVAVKKAATPVDHELYGSETLPVVDKTYFATTSGWAADNDSHAEIVNDYDIHIALVNSKESEWQSQVFVNPGFTWEVGAYYKMELDLTTNNQLGGVHFKVNNKDAGFFDSYPNDNLFLADQTTHFVADSILVSEEPTDGGQLIFSIGWCDANTDILISNIVITKYEAQGVGDKVALEFEDGWVDNDYFEEYGSTDVVLYNIPVVNNAFAGDGQYLNLDIYPEDANDITGTYTIDDETLDDYYTYMMVIEGADTAEVVFTAGEVTFEVLEADVEQGIAEISIVAELTAEDGTIYTINGTFVLYYGFIDDEQDVENVAIDPKAIKRIEMGTLVIEKNGVRYSVNGQVVR